jgi:hypothetical protein
VEILALDTLYVTLSTPFPNDAALEDPTTYTITGDTPVEVFAARAGGRDKTTETIVLTVKGLAEQGNYILTLSTQLVSAEDQTVQEPNLAPFIARSTKMDTVLSRLPPMFSRAHDANLRTIMHAIFREDDLIGGKQDE